MLLQSSSALFRHRKLSTFHEMCEAQAGRAEYNQHFFSGHSIQMPEGPEVYIIVKQLRARLVGRKITSITVPRAGGYVLSAGIRGAFARILPATIKYVGSKGKFIWFWLKSGNRDIFIGNSLGLSGVWTFSGPESPALAIFTISGLRAPLFYSDARHFGKFTRMDLDALNSKLDKIGPDILEASPRPTLTASGRIILQEMAEDNARAPGPFIKQIRARAGNISQLLMNQKSISGVGNYVKAEALYRARIWPGAKPSALPDRALRALFTSILNIARESLADAGVSFRDFVDTSGKKGTFGPVIYRAQQDPAGRDVHADDFGDGRTTYWVPSVQKIGRP